MINKVFFPSIEEMFHAMDLPASEKAKYMSSSGIYVDNTSMYRTSRIIGNLKTFIETGVVKIWDEDFVDSVCDSGALELNETAFGFFDLA